MAVALLAAGLLVAAANAAASAGPSPDLPRPAVLEPDIRFWVDVYTQAASDGGYLHDPDDLDIVYHQLRFPAGADPALREQLVEDLRQRYRDALLQLAGEHPEPGIDARRIAPLFGESATPGRFLRAAQTLRFQQGQADRFRDGLRRAGAYRAYIKAELERQGLPTDLAALPHVESSYNPAAGSHAGAMGLWQFMPATGRQYLRIDAAVDERLDPWRATEAAVRLLQYNHRVLGTWPLALTAYNRGAAGMRRARDVVGSDDIARIVREYREPGFGFASRNFYVSFLAALQVDRDPDRYFGALTPLAPTVFHEVELPVDAPLPRLVRVLKVELRLLRELNPALRPAVWRGRLAVPRGYRLRLPALLPAWTPAQLADSLARDGDSGPRP
ncbi:MAG: hypothetical protein RL026_1003 [Pseudomonadota bacterium]|jgi:membrane-bound lytic murein transglycosylase D